MPLLHHYCPLVPCLHDDLQGIRKEITCSRRPCPCKDSNRLPSAYNSRAAPTIAWRWALLEQSPSQPCQSIRISKIHLNIVLPSVSRSSKWSLSFWLTRDGHCSLISMLLFSKLPVLKLFRTVLPRVDLNLE
jgi:hypothetical protein